MTSPNPSPNPDPLAKWNSKSAALWRLVLAAMFALTYLLLARFLGERVAIATLAFCVARNIQSHENLRDCVEGSLHVIQKAFHG